jgi:alkylated DNA repair dioxygenase AlkB
MKHYLNEYIYVLHEPGSIQVHPSVFEDAWNFSESIKSTPNPMNPNYMIRRKQITFGAQYNFSGQKSLCIPLDQCPTLVSLVLEDVRKRSGCNDYNVVHTNWYPDGSAGLDPHADNENDMIPNMDIYSYTFLSEPGNPRGFQIYSMDDVKKPKLEVFLDHCDLLIMSKGMQKYFKHGVKKSMAKKFHNLKRINMTVRAWKN